MTNQQKEIIKQAQREYEASYEHCGKPIAIGWNCRRKAGHEKDCSVGMEPGFSAWFKNGKK